MAPSSKSSSQRNHGKKFVRMRALKPAPRNRLPQNARDFGTHQFYAMPLTAFEDEEICCACDLEPDEGIESIGIECDGCTRFQHVDCATPITGVLEVITTPLCNDCKMAELHRHFTSQRQQFEQLAAMLRAKRAEADELCANVVWKHYCNLPDGQSSDAILEMTRTEFRDGAMIPVHAPPRSWIEQVQNCIAKMMEDAGEDMIKSILGHTYSANLITETGHLAYWRELAMRLLYRGPYRGNQAELGIMAEVLGFRETGTVWKEV